MIEEPISCKKCKVSFVPWNPLVAKKIRRGHVPLCKDCWASVYGTLYMDMGKVARVRDNVENATIPPAGTKVFICLECKAESREHWTSRVRAARLKCPSCGSIKYEPKTAAAKKDLADLREIAKAAEPEKDRDQKYGSFKVQ